MRVIFLDVDGVLNSGNFMLRQFDEGQCTWPHDHIDPDAVARLNRLREETDAVVVLSSSWRTIISLVDFKVLMHMSGFDGEIIDKTPRIEKLDGFPRAGEIREWLGTWEGEHVDGFVVIDDSYDAEIEGHFVQTDYDTGLLDEHVDAAVEILLGGYACASSASTT